MAKGFWVLGRHQGDEVGPTYLTGEQSAEDAIGGFIESLAYDGVQWNEGECEVWQDELGGVSRKFRTIATYSSYDGEDAEDGEVECELTIEELEQ